MPKITPSELKRMINVALTHQIVTVSVMAGSAQRDNPQVVEMRLRAEGRAEALDDVLQAMNGDLFGLLIETGARNSEVK